MAAARAPVIGSVFSWLASLSEEEEEDEEEEDEEEAKRADEDEDEEISSSSSSLLPALDRFTGGRTTAGEAVADIFSPSAFALPSNMAFSVAADADDGDDADAEAALVLRKGDTE